VLKIIGKNYPKGPPNLGKGSIEQEILIVLRGILRINEIYFL